MPNQIAEIKTVTIGSDSQPAHAIMIALNVDEPQTAETFVAEVAHSFKLQRTMSPPTTTAMLVTIVGPMDAASFARAWNALQTSDEILRFYMSQMQRADVIHGTREGAVIDQASLVASI